MERERKVHIRNGYSDRNNIDKISETVQIDNFSKRTRVLLKNKIFEIFKRYQSRYYSEYEYESKIINIFSKNVFIISLESKEANYDYIMSLVFDCYDNGLVDEIISLTEFIANNLHLYRQTSWGNTKVDLCEELNQLFKDEFIGYRFVDNKIIPITSDFEIAEIKKVLEGPYENVKNHISKSISLLRAKDFHNSIKESISAVELICNIINKSKGKSLNIALEELSGKKKIHPAFKKGITSLYGYSSDEDGIRHDSDSSKNDIYIEDAMFFLIVCSSFINYVISIK